MIPWTIYYHPTATADMRRIPRGEASPVTEAIRALATKPIPLEAVTVGPAMPNTYLLDVGGHVIAYEVREAQRVIRVLWIG